jgi:predicted nucleotidyltransferase
MPELDLPSDYRDLLVEFVDHGVQFVLVGGWAVAVHGHGRATDDMDLFIDPTPENARRTYQALVAFGAPVVAHGVTEDLFAQAGYGYRLGRRPILIEILTAIDGVTFDEARHDALSVDVDGRAVRVIGRAALLRNKRAAGRVKDLADVEALEERES